MKNQQNQNNSQSRKYQQGSGSAYHREHASHVPDYGANSLDPNAEGVMDTSENKQP